VVIMLVHLGPPPAIDWQYSSAIQSTRAIDR